MLKTIKLVYIGKQEFPGEQSVRLWNLIAPGHKRHQSTLSLDTLKEIGVIKYANKID